MILARVHSSIIYTSGDARGVTCVHDPSRQINFVFCYYVKARYPTQKVQNIQFNVYIPEFEGNFPGRKNLGKG